MSTRQQLAETFHTLHVRGQPLLLFNAWDAGSARAIEKAGAKAIATGSWSVAAANGYADGEKIPLDAALANLERIVAAVDVPVSIDLESGYSATPDGVGKTVARAVNAGAIGCNLEDSYPDNGKLRGVNEQIARLAAARKAAGDAFFINARTDVYFQKDANNEETKVAAVIERASAYADAGADGLFVPGLANIDSIRRIVDASPLPVNIMVSAQTPPLAELARAGVARISHGPGPYIEAMQRLEQAARDVFAQFPT